MMHICGVQCDILMHVDGMSCQIWDISILASSLVLMFGAAIPVFSNYSYLDDRLLWTVSSPLCLHACLLQYNHSGRFLLPPHLAMS